MSVQSAKSKVKDKENIIPIVAVLPNTDDLSINVGTYYRFDEPINTLNIKLPIVRNDINKLESSILLFTTGDTPAVTITSNSNISYFSGYSIEPNTTYEINLMFNGAKWIVAYGVVE